MNGLTLQRRTHAAGRSQLGPTGCATALAAVRAIENTRSRAIPERLGVTQEGVLRRANWLYDHFVDLAAYSMPAAEWQRGAVRTA